MAWWLCLFLMFILAVWLWTYFSATARSMLDFLYCEETPCTKFAPARARGRAPLDADSAGACPQVTIIVPGRNEGHVLRRTLGSLCNLDYPNYQVIFVDDQSTDDTAAICRELQDRYTHLSVVKNTRPPPPGWGGKVWAIHQAAQYVGNPVTLFTDSDIWHHPQSLRKMVELQRHLDLDMLSLLPNMERGGVVEQSVMLLALHLIFTLISLHRSNDPRTATPLTGGAYMLLRTAAYRRIGGHAAIQSQLVEDLALGARMRSYGFRVFTVCTHDLLAGRMYEGIADTFRGLKKNAYSGLHCNPLLAILAALVMFLTSACVPF
ncbi:MAG: glycosyltransferase [Phycisphaerae bacterium]